MKQIDFEQHLSAEVVGFLRQIAEVCRDQSVRGFVVGGMVRDMLLGVPSSEVDILIEGEARDVAAYLQSTWRTWFPESPEPRKLVTFKRYHTAKLLFDDEFLPGMRELDFASTRVEQYPTAGQAPDVQLGDLESDLVRRDFSINAIAAELSSDPPAFGALYDLFGGVDDLAAGQLRVLHPQSFVDDPARLIRGARFCARFDFSYVPDTQMLVETATSECFLERLPAARRFDEFRKALAETDVAAVLQQLQSQLLLEQIVPALTPSSELFTAVQSTSGGWQERLVQLLGQLSDEAFRAQLVAFAFSPRQVEQFVELRGQVVAR